MVKMHKCAAFVLLPILPLVWLVCLVGLLVEKGARYMLGRPYRPPNEYPVM
jgi:hypothetical protein